MYDFSQPNQKPGVCCKCRGTGEYRWGAMVNGKMTHTGTCFSCRGTGKQSAKQIRTNHGYNRFKMAAIAACDFGETDPENIYGSVSMKQSVEEDRRKGRNRR